MALPSSCVDHLFARLTVRYGAAFLRQWPDTDLAVVKADWADVLDGVRGQPGVDRAVLAQMLSTLSHWAAGMAPWLSELDLNPVLVGPAGPTAVDCVMVLRHDPGATQAQG